MELCMGCMAEINAQTRVCPHCGYEVNTPVKEAYYLTPGTILQGRYLVGKVLGHGGFGITYLGYDCLLNRKVAVKEYFPGSFATRSAGTDQVTIYSGDAQTQYHAGLRSFLEEAKKLAEFSKVPEIVDIYDCLMDNNTGYIIMDLLQGKTVRDLLNKKNGKLSYEETENIILYVLDGLIEVHKGGIIHRDIAPDNIMITNDGQVKLLDFGAARHTVAMHSISLSVILKPGYAPEEQYRSNGKQGPWTDVYAVGATMYRMLTGQKPLPAPERMAEDSLITPSQMGIQIPAYAEKIIMHALALRKENRIQDAKTFRDALLNHTDSYGNSGAAGSREYYGNTVSFEQLNKVSGGNGSNSRYAGGSGSYGPGGSYAGSSGGYGSGSRYAGGPSSYGPNGSYAGGPGRYGPDGGYAGGPGGYGPGGSYAGGPNGSYAGGPGRYGPGGGYVGGSNGSYAGNPGSYGSGGRYTGSSSGRDSGRKSSAPIGLILCVVLLFSGLAGVGAYGMKDGGFLREIIWREETETETETEEIEIVKTEETSVAVVAETQPQQNEEDIMILPTETTQPETQPPQPETQPPQPETQPQTENTEKQIHRYQIVQESCTWTQAANRCQQMGGYLVRINTQEEFDYIVNQIVNENKIKGIFFIGGKRMSDSRDYHWVDSNGQIISGDILNDSDNWSNSKWLRTAEGSEPSFHDDSIPADEYFMDMFCYENNWVWNDIPDDIVSAVPSYRDNVGFICEFDN